MAGYRTWADLGRGVRAGEKAIWIIAPVTRRREANTTQVKAADAENPLLRKEPADAQAAGNARRVCGFRAVPVFDVAQTEGDPLPEVSHRLLGAAPCGLLTRLVEVAEEIGYPVRFTALPGGRNGQCDFTTGTIAVEDRNSPAQQCKTLCHELAHAILHEHVTDRGLAECEAESVAYVLCHTFGIDTGDYSFGYLAGWAGGGEQAVTAIKTSGECVHQAVTRILRILDAIDGPGV